jgi:hypothetical protein
MTDDLLARLRVRLAVAQDATLRAMLEARIAELSGTEDRAPTTSRSGLRRWMRRPGETWHAWRARNIEALRIADAQAREEEDDD